MKLKTFTVHDCKAESYLQPFYAQATGAAIRMFEDAVNQEGHQFNRYAADYTLFELGTFDQATAAFEVLPAAINLGNALVFKRASITPLPELDPQSSFPQSALPGENPALDNDKAQVAMNYLRTEKGAN